MKKILLLAFALCIYAQQASAQTITVISFPHDLGTDSLSDTDPASIANGTAAEIKVYTLLGGEISTTAIKTSEANNTFQIRFDTKNGQQLYFISYRKKDIFYTTKRVL